MFDSGIAVDALAEVQRAAIIADAAATTVMLDYEAQEIEASHHEPTPVAGLIARSMIPREIGQAVGWSERHVQSRLHAARTVRSRAPKTWTAFTAGRIDVTAVREISSTIDKLQHPESVTLLDQQVTTWAPGHTTAELRRWLRRFIQRVETDEAITRAENERTKRYVKVDHGDDGMSWITAYLPSHVAGAIERRLHKTARATTGTDRDGRTLAQIEADLLTGWLTTTEGDTHQLNVHIAIKIDADVLAGARTGFAEAADGAGAIPADWAAQLVRDGNPFWHRMIIDPVTDDVLTHEYTGRFAPATAALAIEFRDGVCTADGCLTPAWKCELDHVIPWPRGSTTCTNLEPKSKAHHAQKSHGMTPKRRRLHVEDLLRQLHVDYFAVA